jgi:parallel beta-helix repeat protein
VRARVERVRVADVGTFCFWLDGSGACTLLGCEAVRAQEHGYYIDASRPCTLDGCVARDCVDAGVVLDFPKSLLRAHGITAPPATQLQAPHSAKARCSCVLLRSHHAQHAHGMSLTTMHIIARAEHRVCGERLLWCAAARRRRR